MAQLTFFSYPSCTSCRKTKKWLRANQVSFDERHLFRETPTVAELKRILELTSEGLDEVLATRSEAYKDLQVNIDEMMLSDVIQLLTKEPKLLRRPILIHGEKLVIGHNVDALRNLVSHRIDLKMSM
ncbi:Spx/MgsR family RNA polymerase-binding regulatory protein [Peribacillus simplex]|uniref:Transcriptional regulator n=2 Tax=Peribacillus simplex TaxID=1478 RepID=A0A223EM06_9BACI|nr:Spx/MgsR family RNA polymerase-binding regulatory protein [Peribacillus simplex]ASS96231.1 transcriptional regulator [Peribacillus simplex NBRC 15720 = DSM 1321]MEC1397347.1 Spx/MgsR family RNA polymerase-binding regulatory protein [Peribacillus simplex]MED3911285.1 Spx/MgsR family RNA polymerase-binding regulatory protein [Peribacillus simplex]MED3985380.1 Spx/MgsR family RNA polymerase-binding regulatory protein [Peribacillus simplex]MED4093871.1 Spx/MgsR family RNA polymerase-binding reg